MSLPFNVRCLKLSRDVSDARRVSKECTVFVVAKKSPEGPGK